MESVKTNVAADILDEATLALTLITTIKYKAMHHVPRFEHAVHSSAHYHQWTVDLEVEGETDAHELQTWQHEVAPHFGDHGPLSTEEVARWWYRQFVTFCAETGSTLVFRSVYVRREDGVAARLARAN